MAASKRPLPRDRSSLHRFSPSKLSEILHQLPNPDFHRHPLQPSARPRRAVSCRSPKPLRPCNRTLERLSNRSRRALKDTCTHQRLTARPLLSASMGL